MTVSEEIGQRADWLESRCSELDGRLERASDAGGELAEAVARFLRFPENAGRLREAYSTFMVAHAGNFSESAVVPPHIPCYDPDAVVASR